MRACLLILVCALAPLAATPWDRDRPGDNHVKSIEDACSGRVDRLPALYYEMRVERLQGLLAPGRFDSEETLARVDDLTVALIRLGRVPAALQWIERKQAALEALKARDVLLYNSHTERMQKNKAVALLARWRTARDAKDLETAVALMRVATESARLNHENGLFLRELSFLQRKLPPADAVFPNALGLTEAHLRGGGRTGALAAAKLEGALPHLRRRLTYGGEHDNADLFYALSLACAMEGRDDDAALCWARVCELVDAGAPVSAAHRLSADALKRALGWHVKADREAAKSRLEQLKAAAKLVNTDRAARISAALERGEHPDTMPDFWVRWMDKAALEPKAVTPAPVVPEHDPKPLIGTALWIGGGAMVLFLFLVVGGVAIFFARRHPSPPKVDEI